MAFDLAYLLFIGSALGFSVLLAICIFLISTSSVYPKYKRSSAEKSFQDPVSGKSIPFPRITDTSSIHLSVIVPAYNEEERLPPMLDECIEFLESRNAKGFKYEIIVVSDGSRDGTVKVANEYCKKLGTEKFRVLALDPNRGKGGAVRLGMQSGRGSMLLFVDADGATKFSDITKLESSLLDILKCDYLKDPEGVEGKLGISIGSRAHLQDEAVAKRSFFRTILMYGFHFLVWFFTVRSVKDTQCGFKLFTRKAARECFESLHLQGWAFDAELLYIAQRLKIPITEVAVNWTEIDGSKVTPFFSWLQMGFDLILIWLRYTIGAWKILAEKNR